MLQNLMHLSQQKFFDLLGTHIDMALLHSEALLLYHAVPLIHDEDVWL